MSSPNPTLPTSPDEIVERVRDRYGRIATGEISGCGCACGAPAETALAQEIGYSPADLAALPEGANLGLGCGAPLAQLRLAPGETVVDLGSGGGIDAFVAARAVGPTGRVIGIDMTPEMIARARAAAARAGLSWVEFRQGRLESLPLGDGTADAATSNCVINLVPDKAAVFREVARVLKPGGRLVVSDIVLERPLPESIRGDLLAWVGCVGGAETRAEYFGKLAAAGLGEVEVLSDVDYVEPLLAAAPEEVQALIARAGVPLAEVRGLVRSLTYRATKPAAG